MRPHTLLFACTCPGPCRHACSPLTTPPNQLCSPNTVDNKLRKKEWIVYRSQSRYWQALFAYIGPPAHSERRAERPGGEAWPCRSQGAVPFA